MKAMEKLKDYIEDENRLGDLNYAHYSNIIDYVNEAIEEIEVLTNENKSLAKTLEKYNKEMINLRKENQELKKLIKN